MKKKLELNLELISMLFKENSKHEFITQNEFE